MNRMAMLTFGLFLFICLLGGDWGVANGQTAGPVPTRQAVVAGEGGEVPTPGVEGPVVTVEPLPYGGPEVVNTQTPSLIGDTGGEQNPYLPYITIGLSLVVIGLIVGYNRFNKRS